MPSPVVSSMFGKVEEANGVQSWPNRAEKVFVSLALKSRRPQANRRDGLLERTLDRFRLSERLKLPSKSISIFPVMLHFVLLSYHTKFEPTRLLRALMWKSGAPSGPVSVRNPGRGKSSPFGDELSSMAVALI